MVVVVPEVHDTEDLGGFGILYHDHVALGVVGLYSHAQVIARLVFVSHLQRCLHRGLLLTSPVPRNSNVSSGSSRLGPRFPGRRMRRKMVLTWVTPSSSLSRRGTLI